MSDSHAVLPGYPDPLWIQAVTLVRGEIERGILKPGMRLAPERELCQQLGISRVTLRRALGHLVEEGVLSASRGRGWYVSQTVQPRKEWPNTLESFTETAARMGLQPRSEVLQNRVDPATIDQAEQLAIAPGTQLYTLERVRLLNDMPIGLDLTRLAFGLAPHLATLDFGERSLYAELAEAGVEPVRADSTIEATKADDRTARHLEIEPGEPILVMHQLALNANGEPLFTSTIRYAGERYRLRTSFSRAAN
jgi:GntR family transcriptional regulator